MPLSSCVWRSSTTRAAHERHGYRARESVMHMAWGITTWPDEYVKDADPPDKGEQALKLWK